MRIRDYEGGRDLADITLDLTRDEAEELVSMLRRLLDQPMLSRIHLSEIDSTSLSKDLTVCVDGLAQPAPV
jgi:hypothetical protein